MWRIVVIRWWWTLDSSDFWCRLHYFKWVYPSIWWKRLPLRNMSWCFLLGHHERKFGILISSVFDNGKGLWLGRIEISHQRLGFLSNQARKSSIGEWNICSDPFLNIQLASKQASCIARIKSQVDLLGIMRQRICDTTCSHFMTLHLYMEYGILNFEWILWYFFFLVLISKNLSPSLISTWYMCFS